VPRTVGDQESLRESLLPESARRLPEALARVDVLLDDPAFFAPFVPLFDPRIGRPSTPVEMYLRLMFFKFRYRLGYESLCREVTDPIVWRRFCRIPLDGVVPHPTLMKLTTRCGVTAVDGLNEALRAKAAAAKLLRTTRVRADTTVIPATSAIELTRNCWPRRSAASPRPAGASRPRAARPARRSGTARGRPGSARTRSGRSCGCGPPPARTRRTQRYDASLANCPAWRTGPPGTASGCWPTPGPRCAVPERSPTSEGTRPARRGGWPAPRPSRASGQRPHRPARRDPADRQADRATRRLGPLPHRQHRRRPDLGRPRRPDPQPRQDQRPYRITEHPEKSSTTSPAAEQREHSGRSIRCPVFQVDVVSRRVASRTWRSFRRGSSARSGGCRRRRTTTAPAAGHEPGPLVLKRPLRLSPAALADCRASGRHAGGRCRRVRASGPRLLGAAPADDRVRPGAIGVDRRGSRGRHQRLLPGRYGIAAFGAGPLPADGVHLWASYGVAAAVAAAMGLLPFAVVGRPHQARPEPSPTARSFPG
jgi:IS5 family transposase